MEEILSGRSIGNGFDPDFAFERGIGVIQYRVDRMRRVAIAGYLVSDELAPMKCHLSGIGLRLAPHHLIGIPTQLRK
jgi:hypothetical protein